MTLVGLVLAYVRQIKLEREVVEQRRALRSELFRRIRTRKPILIAGWRFLKSWHQGGTYERTITVKPHWELDVRRNTQPVKQAETP